MENSLCKLTGAKLAGGGEESLNRNLLSSQIPKTAWGVIHHQPMLPCQMKRTRDEWKKCKTALWTVPGCVQRSHQYKMHITWHYPQCSKFWVWSQCETESGEERVVVVEGNTQTEVDFVNALCFCLASPPHPNAVVDIDRLSDTFLSHSEWQDQFFSLKSSLMLTPKSIIVLN